jgi:hypothetical protein
MENVTLTADVQAAVDKILALKAQLNTVKAAAKAEKLAKRNARMAREAELATAKAEREARRVAREARKADKVRAKVVRDVLVIMRQHKITVEDLEADGVAEAETPATVH